MQSQFLIKSVLNYKDPVAELFKLFTKQTVVNCTKYTFSHQILRKILPGIIPSATVVNEGGN